MEWVAWVGLAVVRNSEREDPQVLAELWRRELEGGAVLLHKELDKVSEELSQLGHGFVDV